MTESRYPNPTPGDLVELLKSDFEMIGETFDEKSTLVLTLTKNSSNPE